MLFLKIFKKVKKNDWLEDILLVFLSFMCFGLMIFLDTLLGK